MQKKQPFIERIIVSILAPLVAGGKSQCLISPAESCIQHKQGRRGQKQEMVRCRRQRVFIVPRGSRDCLCSGSLLEMSHPSRSAFSQSPQGKGCFYSQLGGTEPFHLRGSFKFLRKSCTGSLGLPSGRHWCCHGALARAFWMQFPFLSPPAAPRES